MSQTLEQFLADIENTQLEWCKRAAAIIRVQAKCLSEIREMQELLGGNSVLLDDVMEAQAQVRGIVNE